LAQTAQHPSAGREKKCLTVLALSVKQYHMGESKMTGVRLNTEEQAMLAKCCQSSERGDLTASELFRLLLRREHARRFGKNSRIQASDYQKEFRNGRPRKTNEQ